MTELAKARPVFIAALPREIAFLVAQRGWRADRTQLARGIHLFKHEDAIIACAGMGASRAALAVEAALAFGPVSELISVGWAGACIPRLRVGEIVSPDVVVDAKTGERFFSEAERARDDGHEILVTAASPAGTTEKARLAESYYASAVDMEAATVARLAQARDLPFCAIKAISDAADFELPDMAGFTSSDGQFRETAFGLHVALHPHLWKPVLKLASGSKLAAVNLRIAMETHIAQHLERRNQRS